MLARNATWPYYDTIGTRLFGFRLHPECQSHEPFTVGRFWGLRWELPSVRIEKPSVGHRNTLSTGCARPGRNVVFVPCQADRLRWEVDCDGPVPADWCSPGDLLAQAKGKGGGSCRFAGDCGSDASRCDCHMWYEV